MSRAKSDYLFTYKERKIKLTNINDYFNIWFWGDVHRDAEACDVDRWKWFLKKAKSHELDRSYFLGMGDYHDFASASERKSLIKSGLHETTMQKLDYVVQRDMRKFAQEISFMRGKLLGLIEGNHTWVFMDGKYAIEDLAERLNTEYCGWLSYISLRVGVNRSNIMVDIVACHGKAGGKLMGTSINQVDDLTRIFPMADIYVMGHNHQRGALPKSILYNPGVKKSTTGSPIKQKRQFLVRSGAFLKSYTPGTGGYVHKALYQPSDLGAVMLKVGFHREITRLPKGKTNDIIKTDIEAII